MMDSVQPHLIHMSKTKVFLLPTSTDKEQRAVYYGPSPTFGPYTSEKWCLHFLSGWKKIN
jgi:hypothetical protein